MHFSSKLIISFLYYFAVNVSFASNAANSNHVLKREKRFLIFPGGGVAKFVAGYLGPIDTEKFINCNAIRNIQYQYNVPPNITTIYSKVPARQRSFSSGTPSTRSDSSRRVAYEVVEDILNREGKDGRECLLRTICQVAETPISHNGLVGELLQLFFTPGKHEKLHQDYRDARKVGLNRVDCEKMYPNCPFGHGLLDSISLIKEYKLQSFLDL